MNRSERARAATLCGLLIVLNAAAWGWAAVMCRGDAVLLGTAVLAYTFGLRHAVDADHIEAIDNATRKLVEMGRPAAAARRLPADLAELADVPARLPVRARFDTAPRSACSAFRRRRPRTGCRCR